MARRVFYSFHFEPDNWRASQVRNIGAIEGNAPVSDNDWEAVKRGGDAAIQRWIDDQLSGRGCTVVLVGSGTAGRKWINYEIEKSWNGGKGLLGIHIHALKDRNGNQCIKGNNPFSNFNIGQQSLASIVQCYDPPYWQSNDAYAYIQNNLSDWVERAVQIRNNY